MRWVDLVTGSRSVENRVRRRDPVVDKSLASMVIQVRTVFDDILVESDERNLG